MKIGNLTPRTSCPCSRRQLAETRADSSCARVSQATKARAGKIQIIRDQYNILKIPKFAFLSFSEIKNHGIFMSNVPYLYVWILEFHTATDRVWKTFCSTAHVYFQYILQTCMVQPCKMVTRRQLRVLSKRCQAQALTNVSILGAPTVQENWVGSRERRRREQRTYELFSTKKLSKTRDFGSQYLTSWNLGKSSPSTRNSENEGGISPRRPWLRESGGRNGDSTSRNVQNERGGKKTLRIVKTISSNRAVQFTVPEKILIQESTQVHDGHSSKRYAHSGQNCSTYWALT